MAFDIGLNFRQTDSYVTDPANTTYVLSDTYPTTRGGATFGWIDVIGGNMRNRNAAIDPRLAGIHFQFNNTKKKFRLDLPASGDVDVYCSAGDAGGGNGVYIELFDNVITLGTLVTKKVVGAGTFYDATDTGYSAANWPASNAKATKFFWSTTLIVAITPGDGTGGNYVITHLRAAQADSGVTGTSATTNANDTSTASGTTTVTGSVSTANADDTADATGYLVITGSVAVTNAPDASTATGSTTVIGDVATANVDDLGDSSGVVGFVASGAVAYTNADDTSSAAGDTTVTGSVDVTNEGDTGTGAGTTTVIGSSATTNANDLADAEGEAETGEIFGILAYTNVDDISAASGTTVIIGSATANNTYDASTAFGVVNEGITVETALSVGVTTTPGIKKAGIPADTKPWLRTNMEIMLGRRGNAIAVPKRQDLTFSATPTKTEVEALYDYTNEVRDALNKIITRFDS